MNKKLVRKRFTFGRSRVLTGPAYSQGRDDSGHLPSRKVPAGTRGDHAPSFPRSVLVWNPKLRKLKVTRDPLFLGSHYPRHRRDGQKRTYLDAF